jgi:peptidoglycan/xylan/chitin deacetylase (PgdA/CDA1 family)
MRLPAPVTWLRAAARAAGGAVMNAADPPVVILLYHRVGEPGSDPQRLAVSPARFREHLERLRARLPVLRFEEDWRGRRKPAAVVTFDDGYADNLHGALPELERAAVPATVFVTTGNVESGREFWWDELERLVLGPGPRPARFEPPDPIGAGAWDARSAGDRQALYAELHPRLMRAADARREAWLSALRRWAGDDGAARPTHRPLTADEVRRLAGHPLATVGAHGVTHTALAALDEDAERDEIAGSRRRLEAWTGRSVTTFSYPFGTRVDFTRRSVRLCRAAGFLKAAANRPGCAHRWTDPYALPRHVVRDWSGTEFDRMLTRLFTL